MDSRSTNEWAVHPGEIIMEELTNRKVSIREMATRCGLSSEVMIDIITGYIKVTPDIAHNLSPTFGITANLWMTIQARYDDQVARRKAQ